MSTLSPVTADPSREQMMPRRPQQVILAWFILVLVGSLTFMTARPRAVIASRASGWEDEPIPSEQVAEQEERR